jgi:uncharacterized repeat protein (TIGR01451 family)
MSRSWMNGPNTHEHVESRRFRMTGRRALVATVVACACAGLAGTGLVLAAHAVIVPISVDPTSAIGNDASQYTDMTPDGRFVAFVSTASNLVPGDTNGVGDVFVRDRLSGVTERVSVGIKGAEGNGDSNFLGIATNPSISNDGRYVAFKSEASNLVRGDRNGVTDVFVRDRLLGITERVSVDSAGREAPGGGDDPAISPDGRFVAFVTLDFDANFSSDVYLRDRVAGTTQRISVAHDGGETQNNSDSPDVAVGAGGGAIVAFASSADNLVANDGNGASDVFVRDLTGATPTTEWVSVTSDEQPPAFAGGFGFGSRSPSISPDGRYVAFSSDAVNFTTPAQVGNSFDVYVRDRQAGTTELASPNGTGGEANAESEGPDISPDGRFVSFSSFATDLVAGTTDPDGLLQDAFVHDRVTGSTEMVSVAADHSDATFSGFDTHVASGPVSADGLVSLMTTNADNLFPGDTNLNSDVYANDRRSATDLSLTITDSPDPVTTRATLTYTIVVTNQGANPAPAAVVSDTLPATVTFVAASPGCVHTTGTVVCDLGLLSAGQSATITIDVTPRRTGTLTNTARVGAAAPDPNPGNNTVSVTTTVAK